MSAFYFGVRFTPNDLSGRALLALFFLEKASHAEFTKDPLTIRFLFAYSFFAAIKPVS